MKDFQGKQPNHFQLPDQITRLGELAYNLWWVWEKEAQKLFTLIDEHLWEETYHNPVLFLRQVTRSKLNAVTYDLFYMESYQRVMKNFDS